MMYTVPMVYDVHVAMVDDIYLQAVMATFQPMIPQVTYIVMDHSLAVFSQDQS